jgi:hypothetical protein
VKTLVSSSFVACLLLSTTVVRADISPIAASSKANSIAAQASNINSVTNLKIGDYSYKVVGMDSTLNGDLDQTTLVIVGQDGVGGGAGYDAAFLLTPTNEASSLVSAQASGDALLLTLQGASGQITKKLQFDAASNTLKELSADLAFNAILCSPAQSAAPAGPASITSVCTGNARGMTDALQITLASGAVKLYKISIQRAATAMGPVKQALSGVNANDASDTVSGVLVTTMGITTSYGISFTTTSNLSYRGALNMKLAN